MAMTKKERAYARYQRMVARGNAQARTRQSDIGGGPNMAHGRKPNHEARALTGVLEAWKVAATAKS